MCVCVIVCRTFYQSSPNPSRFGLVVVESCAYVEIYIDTKCVLGWFAFAWCVYYGKTDRAFGLKKASERRTTTTKCFMVYKRVCGCG